MIFGAVIEPDMGDEIRITVIATGFERSGMPRRIATNNHSVLRDQKSNTRTLESVSVEASSGPAAKNDEFKPKTFNTEDLDIPTFLRNRK